MFDASHEDRALELSRPLVCFDLETTGLNVAEDRIVELCGVKINPDGTRETKVMRLNPGQPIPKQAQDVHGIGDADVADCPGFADVADSLGTWFDGCDLSGFNIEQFDLPLLKKEFERAGAVFPGPGVHVVDAWRIYMQREPRDLAAAYRFYCDKPLNDAHSAEADALAAADVLEAQLVRYPDLPRTPEALQQQCHPRRSDWIDPQGRLIWVGKEAALGFGKHRNRKLSDLVESERGYLEWMSRADFSNEVVTVIRAALEGDFTQPGSSESRAR